jgi:hypothetical protein
VLVARAIDEEKSRLNTRALFYPDWILGSSEIILINNITNHTLCYRMIFLSALSNVCIILKAKV